MNLASSAAASHPAPAPEPQYRFADLIAPAQVRQRWEKVRRFFFLRESTYDMTRRCNIRCNGCYYYQGPSSDTIDNADPDDWRDLMIAEKERGITFVVLAGAEPSLVPELCRVCYAEMPLGTIATNGLKRLPAAIDYQIHISVWGNDRTSQLTRNHKDMLARQLDNYASDPRAVFVYTFTRHNIFEAAEVAEVLARHDCRLTFNVFSAPVGYEGDLHHTPQSLTRTRNTMIALMDRFPQTVLFSHYNAMAHTHPLGLHALFGCSYPRCNPSRDIGLGRSFRQYRTDLTWDRQASCCVPNTACDDCRHYAAGSAIVTARLYRHATDPDTFNAWLDYVDTYLAVWVRGYEKDNPLCRKHVAPPGSDLPPG